MSKEIPEQHKRVNLSDPIVSGYESADVRWSLPYRKQQYHNENGRSVLGEGLRTGAPEDGEDRRGRATNSRAEVGALAKTTQGTLVYSSIFHRKPSDPTERIDIYPVSVKLVRAPLDSYSGQIPPDRTGLEIKGFSKKSRAKLRFCAVNSRDYIQSQFCMTYHEVLPMNGRILKSDLDKFLKRVRRKFPEVRYIWIAEFQTRQAPHFHFFSDIPVNTENHEFLANAWHVIAGFNRDSHYRVHAFGDNFCSWDMYSAGYLCKYLDKEYQKVIPLGFASFGRFWGNSHNLTPKVEEEITRDLTETFAVRSQEKPWEYLVRTVCRYQEKVLPLSTIRHTPQSRTVYTGASIAKKTFEYLLTDPKGWNK